MYICYKYFYTFQYIHGSSELVLWYFVLPAGADYSCCLEGEGVERRGVWGAHQTRDPRGGDSLRPTRLIAVQEKGGGGSENLYVLWMATLFTLSGLSYHTSGGGAALQQGPGSSPTTPPPAPVSLSSSAAQRPEGR